MTMELLDALLFATLRTATPLIWAGLGALLAERSGVLNLGQEGTMIMGAVCAFLVAWDADSLFLGTLGAALAGTAMAVLFGAATLWMQANQVAAGLALSIFGLGLAAFIGADVVGVNLEGLSTLAIPVLSDIPVVGRALFAQDLLVYVAWCLVPLLIWVLNYSHWGMIIRAVGENPHAAHALGISVFRVRFVCLAVSGALVGIAGAYLSLAYTPIWTEGMTAGRGWIALALVVFASWRVGRLFWGALLFGFASILHLLLQGMGIAVASNLLAMGPYLVTIIALVLLSLRNDPANCAPRSLSVNFNPH